MMTTERPVTMCEAFQYTSDLHPEVHEPFDAATVQPA